ncbi:MMPL family transporter [Streptomyces rishiriensis]|uniref:RND superfamily putative drug exporter n=1 Tax=Streptomyces rishiriensis TaxID=68264 RepID=A0ABU0P1P7_STRRH|nr:MMPL family transporter [Streptomyces rishiriensis]MDQ0585318.1 RND superfamily putative drug exporter [Streptomyces rishiriensis]
MRVTAIPSGRRAKWAVLAFWIGLLAVASVFSGKFDSVVKNEVGTFLPSNAESTQAIELAKKFTPDISSAVVIYERADGDITADDRAVAKADAGRFAQLKHVTAPLVGPVVAKDGRAIEIVVPVKAGGSGQTGSSEIEAAVKEMRSILDSHPTLTTHVTGPAGYAADQADAFAGADKALLLLTVAIVFVILLLTYRSPVLWIAPLICVGVALFVAQAAIYLFARYGSLTVKGDTQFILTVLVFGAGTDYALLLIARYREELRRHEDRHEAMAVALRRSGSAIVASAVTLMLSLLCFLAADLNSTKSLGPALAIGVASALVAMVTLLPALLVILGRWMFWPVRPTFGSPQPPQRGPWEWIGSVVSRRPRATWIGSSAVLGVLALGLIGFTADNMQMKDSFTSTPEAVTGEQAMAVHFPAGGGDPAQIIGAAGAAGPLRSAVAATPGITDVTQPVVKDGHVYLEGTLTAASNSKAAFATVDRLRDAVHAVPGAEAKVGGGNAVNLDYKRAAQHDRTLLVPLVLIVVGLIIGALLRAVVAPLVLLATVVLSFAAALGVSALTFRHIFGFAGADPAIPLWIFVFLIALGVDYNIFLMTRVHEESKAHGTRRGALRGLNATGGVITSAGIVLAGTFAALATLPLVFAAQIGFAVAFGVLLDTFLVRSVLVTALTYDLGRRMWWPSALSRAETASDPEELAPQALAQR